jgi:hypothetical protein
MSSPRTSGLKNNFNELTSEWQAAQRIGLMSSPRASGLKNNFNELTSGKWLKE